MIEETLHFVLSRFERTRNSLERILTINYFIINFFRRERCDLPPLSLVISLTLGGILLQQRDRYWDIALPVFANSYVAH